MSRELVAAAKRLRWRMLKPVLEKTGAIELVYRKWERHAARTPAGDFKDALPMPPPELMVAVAGTPDRRWFSTSGRLDAEFFRGFAARYGAHFADQRVVVDLGCGCGRIARWLAPEVVDGGGRFIGYDINAGLAAWCDANLPGDYQQNQLRPPLPLPDGAADIVYAYSVFTHLREPTAIRWLEEIARVLRPGGLALVTFHDETFAELRGLADVRTALETQPYFVLNDALEGSNYISAWTTRAHFSQLVGARFEPLEILPGRSDLTQAIAVLSRR